MKDCCSRCKRPFTDKELKDRRDRISKAQKASYWRNRLNGNPFGRKNRVDLPKALELREKGLSYAKIGKELGVTDVAAMKAIKKFIASGSVILPRKLVNGT